MTSVTSQLDPPRAAPPDDAAGEREVFRGSVRAAGMLVHLAGIAVRVGGETVTGAAGSLDADPYPRAVAELAERLSLLEAIRTSTPEIPIFDEHRRPLGVAPSAEVFPESAPGATFRYSRSSGVAAGTTFADAACRARFELEERDAVLRSWYGESRPGRLSEPRDVLPAPLFEAYDVEAYAFGDRSLATCVAGIFAFPRAERPLVFGFGARRTEASAMACAASELVQRLGFLWDEPLPQAPPPPSPVPDFHQEYYLFAGNHSRLRAWLRGGHVLSTRVLVADARPAEPVYVDLGSSGGMTVVKALPRGHVPLVFGVGHPALAGDVPDAVAVHPIP